MSASEASATRQGGRRQAQNGRLACRREGTGSREGSARPRLAPLARAALLLAAQALACRQIVGTEERSNAGLHRCSTCAEQRCAAELSACRADSACEPVEACFEACAEGDAVCHERCKRAAAPSGGAIADLESCRASECAAECDLGCGSFAWASPYESIDSCRACVRTSCCEAAAACGADPACQRLSWCREGCVTLSCFQTCWIDNFAGKQLADLVNECAADSCLSECGIGRNWSCVPAAWPESSSLTLELAFQLYEFGAQKDGVPGITVRVCELADIACTDPIEQGTTNAKGIVVFDLQGSDVGGFFRGFDQYLDVDVAGTGYMPTLYQLSPPVTSPYSAQITAMIKEEQFAALLSGVGAGVDPDPNRGHVVLEVEDCSGSHAPDLQFSVEGSNDGVVPVYFNSLMSVGAQASTSVGLGGLFNVKPGFVTVIGTVRQTGQVVGKVNVLVRAGTLTSSNFNPSPL